ncbi:nuclear transport factor 2 family protein [Pseudoalteromonas sp. Of7M-16]|uniref:nuclear transport factor 2 family protein n=1 Tax=Pseudoalteromonas sp. Of7M-16 TaxID=2917756 RepID=UPI001EF47A09|nr:nuclear transport factor 2 family protein [Pseudoalteromonas sp. Of7M-16]MCG7546579.1 nuclear transport factor 2 family protein [Pseudoalteromonas sp. Of7M-16]
MKKYQCFLFLVTLLHTPIGAAQSDDETAIRAAINKYFAAFSEAKAQNLQDVFLPEMQMIGNVRGKPWILQGDKLAEGLKTRAPETLKTRVYFIDITHDAAMAKVNNVNVETGTAYTDYLFFLKVQNEWKIAHKGYTRFKQTVTPELP